MSTHVRASRHRDSVFLSLFYFPAIALLLAGSPQSAAAQIETTASTEGELISAILAANATPSGSGNVISLLDDITLTQSLPMITNNITFAGNGFLIEDGAGDISLEAPSQTLKLTEADAAVHFFKRTGGIRPRALFIYKRELFEEGSDVALQFLDQPRGPLLDHRAAERQGHHHGTWRPHVHDGERARVCNPI